MKFEIGDTVAYSAEFCRNTGQQTGSIPFARGTIKNLLPLSDTFLAIIEWDNVIDVTNKVIVGNLIKVEKRF